MPKKPLTNDQVVISLYLELLKVIDPHTLGIAENLEGDELKSFCLFCHQTFHNEFFKKIVRGFVFDQCMMTAQAGVTTEQYMNGKLMVAGIFALQEYFAKFAGKYDAMTAKEEDFDPRAAFSQAKV